MLNFYQWCKTPSSAFSKTSSATTLICGTFSIEPLVIYNWSWKLSHRLRDIRLLSIPWPWNPGYGSLKVIENYTSRSGTHDVLLTFIVTIVLFRTVSEINGHFRRKSPIIPTHIPPDEEAPLGIWYQRKGSQTLKWWGYQRSKKF